MALDKSINMHGMCLLQRRRSSMHLDGLNTHDLTLLFPARGARGRPKQSCNAIISTCTRRQQTQNKSKRRMYYYSISTSSISSHFNSHMYMYRCCHLDVITKGKLLIYNWYKQRYKCVPDSCTYLFINTVFSCDTKL